MNEDTQRVPLLSLPIPPLRAGRGAAVAVGRAADPNATNVGPHPDPAERRGVGAHRADDDSRDAPIALRLRLGRAEARADPFMGKRSKAVLPAGPGAGAGAAVRA